MNQGQAICHAGTRYEPTGEGMIEQNDIGTICRRIGVQPPYFAFSSLRRVGDGAIEGSFTPEQPLGYERGPIAIAEIGRHLAILGSCAAAFAHSDRIYYLATEARQTRFRQPDTDGLRKTLHAKAEVIEHNRRDLTAQAVLSDETPFAHLRVRYQALSEPVFKRLFLSYRSEHNQHIERSPYTSLPPLEFEEPEGRSLTARGTLLPQHCAGHFPDYPAWPVAIIGYNVVRVIERLLHHLVGKAVPYTVITATTNADLLVSVADPLLFRAVCIFASDRLAYYAFSCTALRNEEIVARLHIEISL